MTLRLTNDRLCVCQLPKDALLPVWAANAPGFCAITRTEEELSIVCAASVVPAGVRQEPGWRAFKVDGPLDFALTGILASLAGPLAKAGVSIYALSTYNTDYVLVKESQLDEAIDALRAVGHTVRAE